MNETLTISKKSRDELTLRILQKKNANVINLLESFDHVVLYILKKQAWVKLGVQGSLYVVKMISGEVYMIVLNREKPEDFSHILTPTKVDIDFQFPYIYIQKKIYPDNVFGIWFHETAQAKIFQNLFQNLMKEYCEEPIRNEKKKRKSEISDDDDDSESSADEESEEEESDSDDDSSDTDDSEDEAEVNNSGKANGRGKDKSFSDVMDPGHFMETLLNFDFMDDVKGKRNFKRRIVKLLDNEAVLTELFRVFTQNKKQRKGRRKK